jgi:GTP-binding nuclear protein Ran
MENYKIVFVGDKCVGKSAWLQRHKVGTFEKNYIPTLGVDVLVLGFYTNYGLITFKMWDCAGDYTGENSNSFYTNADGAICMFDLTDINTYSHIPEWIENVRKISPGVPVVICGNKSDLTPARLAGKTLNIENTTYFTTSARSCYNFDKPFVALARQLTGHRDLEFVEGHAIEAPEVEVDIE